MARLVVGLVAQADLRDIRRFSQAAFGVRRTCAYLVGLRAAFEMILERPSVGRPERDLGDGMRSFGYRSHRIYYRVQEDGARIVRILHHAREIDQAFGDAS